MKAPIKPAAQILKGNRHLHSLLLQAQTLSQLQVLVHNCLAPALREQLRLGSYKNGVLTLVLADAAWATRLRYQEQQLITQLRQHDPFAGLQQIRLKVRPANTEDNPPAEERRYLSHNASAQIRQDAAQIEHPELRAALQRLAKNTRPEQEQP